MRSSLLVLVLLAAAAIDGRSIVSLSSTGALVEGPFRTLVGVGCKHPSFVSPAESSGSGYVVRRNVKDFGAVGDGVHDDSEAFINALAWQKATTFVPDQPWNNSQYNCQTTKPSIVIVPRGKYRITQLLPLTFYTQLVGESFTDRPSLNFEGHGYHALDAGQDEGPGNGWYGNVNQNNFYHQLRNVVINITKCRSCVALHWQVSQATNVVNVHFELGSAEQTGILMENGSGGYLGDITMSGGGIAMNVGNQQFTFKNISIQHAQTAIRVNWNWVMTFSDVHIRHVGIAIHLAGGVGTVSILDAVIQQASTAILVDAQTSEVVLENVNISSCPTVLRISDAFYNLRDPAAAHDWVNGRFINGSWLRGPQSFPPRPPKLLRPDGSGSYFNQMRPDFNASGDAFTLVVPNGTDVTHELSEALQIAAAANASLFLPYGVYYISDTVVMPVGTSLYGEVWTRLLAYGANFSDPLRPRVMLQVGRVKDEVGVAQLADLMFSNAGPVPGAILVQWNARGAVPGDAAAWDVHYRIGGFDGSLMPPELCPVSAYITDAPQCHGAHTLLEVTGSLYLENCWGWVADHNIDQGLDNNIFSARGFVSRSTDGPVWLYGTAMEHSTLFQYYLDRAESHYLGIIQTETPYYQPQVTMDSLSTSVDPHYLPNQTHAFALAVEGGTRIAVYGTGLYSFFHNWTTATCGGGSYGTLPPCQQVLIRFDGVKHSELKLHNLNTHGASTVLLLNALNVSAANSTNGFCQTTSYWGTAN